MSEFVLNHENGCGYFTHGTCTCGAIQRAAYPQTVITGGHVPAAPCPSCDSLRRELAAAEQKIIDLENVATLKDFKLVGSVRDRLLSDEIFRIAEDAACIALCELCDSRNLGRTSHNCEHGGEAAVATRAALEAAVRVLEDSK